MPDSVVPSKLSVSVVVVTLQRPEVLRICLQHLVSQTVPAWELVVVDASPDQETRHLIEKEFPSVRYLKNPLGPGTTGASRNLGLAAVTGDIIAFIDDDAFAYVDWIEQLLKPYMHQDVGGVGGRALNGQPGEDTLGVEEIGQFRADGTLTGNFAANPGHTVEVDHFLGANMSFRREVLLSLGGIRDGYPGTCLREETDLAVRVKRAGWQLIFTPFAVVEHVGAPYPKGRRFDVRYTYYAERNHIVFLIRVVGFLSPELRCYLGIGLRSAKRELTRGLRAPLGIPGHGIKRPIRSLLGGLARASAIVLGLIVGLQSGIRQTLSDRN